MESQKDKKSIGLIDKNFHKALLKKYTPPSIKSLEFLKSRYGFNLSGFSVDGSFFRPGTQFYYLSSLAGEFLRLKGLASNISRFSGSALSEPEERKRKPSEPKKYEFLPKSSGVSSVNILKSVLPSRTLLATTENFGLDILKRVLPLFDHVHEGLTIHTDPLSNKIARKLGADAFTMGGDIFFASGKFNLTTPEGISLFAHELTHVQQQEETGGLPAIARYEALEGKALANEKAVLSYLKSPLKDFTNDPGDNMLLPITKEITRNTAPSGSAGIERSDSSLTYLNFPRLASVQNKQVPMIAAQERDTGTETILPKAITSPPAPAVDIELMTEQVYENLKRRLEIEKERMGI